MNDYVKNIAKSAVLMGVIGVALGIITPVLAPMLLEANVVGGAIASNTPLWLGGFFAAFGAFRAGAQPLIDSAFGDKSFTASIEAERGKATALQPSVTKENEHCACNHVEKLAAQSKQNILQR